jgi:hypothetical protein
MQENDRIVGNEQVAKDHSRKMLDQLGTHQGSRASGVAPRSQESSKPRRVL